MARTRRTRRFTCKQCVEDGRRRPFKGFSPQEVQAHRVEKHGASWPGKGRARKATSAIPTKKAKGARKPGGAGFKRELLKHYTVPELLREIGDRAEGRGR